MAFYRSSMTIFMDYNKCALVAAYRLCLVVCAAAEFSELGKVIF